MTIRNPAEIQEILPPGTRLMGLDVGTKTIGIALSDTRRIIATPVETIRRGRFRDDARRIQSLMQSRGAGALVIGLPIALDGSEGPRCQSVRQFARNLLDAFGPEITFWDERLSTAAVTRGMLEADLTRKRRAEIVDRAAAAYILQGFLDRMAA